MCQRVTLEATNLYTCQNKSWDHYMCIIPTVIGCKPYEYLSQNYRCIDRKIEITEINVQQSTLTFFDLMNACFISDFEWYAISSNSSKIYFNSGDATKRHLWRLSGLLKYTECFKSAWIFIQDTIYSFLCTHKNLRKSNNGCGGSRWATAYGAGITSTKSKSSYRWIVGKYEANDCIMRRCK